MFCVCVCSNIHVACFHVCIWLLKWLNRTLNRDRERHWIQFNLRIMKRFSACRETAFAYAITAAGVSYALTRACSDGSFKGCQCVSTNRHKLTSEGWEYEGCHDNVKFGYRIGKKFVDSRERGRDFRATVNLHNNEAGRVVSVIFFFFIVYFTLLSRFIFISYLRHLFIVHWLGIYETSVGFFLFLF